MIRKVSAVSAQGSENVLFFDDIRQSKRLAPASSLVILVWAAIIVAGIALQAPASAAAQTQDRGYIDWEMRGFTYSSWWDDEFLRPESDVTFDRIRDTGTNWVSLTVTQYMDYGDSNSISPWQHGRTASDAAVIEAISDAHARGMKVMLKPIVDIRYEDYWRGDIVPSSVAAWFDSYRQFINHYAQISEQYGVEMFVAGCELASMSGREYYGEWEQTIAEIRARYSGKLTYSASLNEYGYACIWEWMDYLGLNFYFPLSESLDPSVEELMAGWWNYDGRYSPANWLERIRTWQSHWGKPVIFAEIGYRSILGTAIAPWDFWTPGVYNGDTQAKAYEAAFRVLSGEPYVIGAFWWNWTVGDTFRNPVNTEYSIVGKPAEAVLTEWYTQRNSSAPRLQMELSDVTWENYQLYQERNLSVSFAVTNVGGSTARAVEVIIAGASNDVTPVSERVSAMGDIAVGEIRTHDAVYLVPQGTSSFRVDNFASCTDSDGARIFFPVAPPGF